MSSVWKWGSWSAMFLGCLGTLAFAQYGSLKPAGGMSSKDSTKVAWPNGARVAVSLTFDDGRASQLDNGIPVLDRYGTKATFYVNPKALSGREGDWKVAARAGHEIGNHTLNHPCTGNFLWAKDHALEDMTIEAITREIKEGDIGITGSLGLVPRTFAYPCGQKYVGRGRETRSYVPVVAEFYLAGRGWRDEGVNDPGYCDLAQLLGMELDGLSFAAAKALIEQAAESGGWLVFAGHDIGPTGRQTVLTSTLEEICRHGSDPANGVWIQTVEKVAGHIHRMRSAHGGQ